MADSSKAANGKNGKSSKKAKAKGKSKAEKIAERPDKKLKLRAVRILADEKAFTKTAAMLKKEPLKGVALVERDGEFLIGIKAADKTDDTMKAFRQFKTALKEGGLLYEVQDSE